MVLLIAAGFLAGTSVLTMLKGRSSVPAIPAMRSPVQGFSSQATLWRIFRLVGVSHREEAWLRPGRPSASGPCRVLLVELGWCIAAQSNLDAFERLRLDASADETEGPATGTRERDKGSLDAAMGALDIPRWP